MEVAVNADLIDLFFLILCLRVIYISIAKGVVCEGFKIAGLLLGAFFAFQFHSFYEASNFKVAFLNNKYLEFISFASIFLSVNGIFSLLRLIVTSLFKRKDIPLGERWALLFVGGARAAFLLSLIIFLLHLSPLDSKYFTQSISYGMFKGVAPRYYLITFGMYKSFYPEANLSQRVEEYLEQKEG